MSYTHVDCFSGPGGFCTGLHAAGFETKVAIEYIKSCVRNIFRKSSRGTCYSFRYSRGNS